MVRLTASDGHELDAYEALPDAAGTGGVVIVQEIFGLTPHMHAVVDRFAAAGLHAVAPAMFDRVGRGIVLDYSEIERGRATMQQLQWPQALADIEAALGCVAPTGRSAVVGFCWGGTAAHLAAAELPIAAAVAYYGGGIVRMLDRKPACPIMYHFGEADHAIPMEAVEQIRLAHPEGRYFVYPGAGHGFACDARSSYDEASAELAFERTVSFLEAELGRA